LPAALALLPAQASEARPAAQALGCVTARKRLTNEAANLLSGNGVQMSVPHRTSVRRSVQTTKIFVDNTNIFVVSCSQMPSTNLPRPTDSELEILRVLWDQGPSTVRDVHITLQRHREIGYTTVLKLLQIMAAKGIVERDETARAHVYKARVAQEQTQRQLVGHLLDRAFGGSATKLMMQALSGRPASAEEIAQMRQMLAEFEKGKEPQP